MSGYPTDEMDNCYTISHALANFRHKNCSINNQGDSLEDDESENLDEPMTIRIPTENIDQLQYESKIKEVSLNARINQIIKDHLDWHSDAHEAKMYCVPKPLITKAADHLTEQELSEFAQSVVNDLQDMSLLLRGEFSFSSFLDILNIWLRITRTPSRFEESEYEYKIVIRHEMGYKYSYLIKEVFRYIIEVRFNKRLHYIMTENTILIRSAK